MDIKLNVTLWFLMPPLTAIKKVFLYVLDFTDEANECLTEINSNPLLQEWGEAELGFTMVLLRLLF